MALFPLPVKAEMTDVITLPSRVLQFGDGYEQIASDGLNKPLQSWLVTVIIASPLDSTTFHTFAREYGAWKSFDWQSPRDTVPRRYRIDGSIPGTVRNGGGNKPVFYTKQLTFTELMTESSSGPPSEIA